MSSTVSKYNTILAGHIRYRQNPTLSAPHRSNTANVLYSVAFMFFQCKMTKCRIYHMLPSCTSRQLIPVYVGVHITRPLANSPTVVYITMSSVRERIQLHILLCRELNPTPLNNENIGIHCVIASDCK